MAVVSTNDLKRGMSLDLPDGLFQVVDFQHVKPGKGGAFVRSKLKRVDDGAVIDKTFKAGEKFRPVRTENRKMQFLYESGDAAVFMDNQSYDQIPFTPEQVGDAKKFLKENLEVSVVFWRGRPIGVELPSFIEALVKQCDPGIKGDTASGATKPATVSTGATVNVPLFVKEGEWIKLDTRTGDYIERVNKG